MGRRENRGREHFKERKRRDSLPGDFAFSYPARNVHIPDPLLSEIPVRTPENNYNHNLAGSKTSLIWEWRVWPVLIAGCPAKVTFK